MSLKKRKRLPQLSLIIPTYKQQKTIKRDIQRIKKTMDGLKFPYEIIVVVDGRVDKTFEKAKEVKARNVSVVGYSHNFGKGYAVRFGIANSKGKIIGFIDAGMDLNPAYIQLLLTEFKLKNADIVIGSKLHPDSKVTYPWQRVVLSWGYRSLVKALFGLSISDSQVGMKFFKRKVLEVVLPRLIVKRYAFDIEILAVAHYLGYKKIFEGPIELRFKGFSSINSKSFWGIIYSMLYDTFAVYYRLKFLHYYDSGKKRKWQYNPELNFRVNLP